MDNFADDGFPENYPTISYDDTVPYEEQAPPSTGLEPISLANRIGQTKVYLLSESSAAARVGKLCHSPSYFGKRKHGEDENGTIDDDDMEEDLTYRPNAILFHGPPISNLSTARLFAYATHFDAHPLGLEWINDNTAVFVFASKNAAQVAYRCLQKSPGEVPDEEGHIAAKSIPVALWPPEARINQSLGKGEGLKRTVKMRWAKVDDVKKKGAKHDSDFYKKHGLNAGKEVYVAPEDQEGPQKRRRKYDEEDQVQRRIQLDDDLDEFLAQDSEDESSEGPPSPPSKMRSDYIAADGRTLLERTSSMREHPMLLASRIKAPLPRRRDGQGRRSERNGVLERGTTDAVTERRNMKYEGKSEERRGRGRRGERLVKSQKELDDELDAFLHDRD